MDPKHDDIERYLNNRMTDAERHALEKRALADPFLADALEGAQSMKPEEFSSEVKALHQKIASPAKPWKLSLRIAAGIFLAVALGWLIWNPSPPGVLQQTSKAPEQAAADSASKTPETTTTLASPPKEKIARAVPRSNQAVIDSSQSKPAEPASGATATISTSAAEPSPMAATKDELAEEAAQPDLQKIDAATKSKRSTAPKRVITGQVTEAEDGIPLADVVVKEASSAQETRTRGDGTYSLPVNTERPLVQYSFPGLKSVEQRAGNEAPLNVVLSDDANQRSEIIAFPPQSWSSSSPDGLVLAVPGEGIPAYQKYLETNLVVPSAARAAKVSGKVTLSFTVEPSGTPANFKVEKGLGFGCDEEVIRLVKTGPPWNAARYRDTAVSSTVWIKVEFR
jgi:TonB family protein